MRRKLRRFLSNTPVLWRVAHLVKDRFTSSQEYWEERYKFGGDSGAGSYSQLAEFKGEVLNEFVAANDVGSVIEFGCGDGNQLRYLNYPSYIGLDVSSSAIRRCSELYADDPTKRFLLYEPDRFSDQHEGLEADATLSLDVLYHLVEDEVFDTYLKHLFATARRFVVIYSSNFDRRMKAHVRHRRFTPVIEERYPTWRLVNMRENPLKKRDDSVGGSFADFYFYAKGAE